MGWCVLPMQVRYRSPMLFTMIIIITKILSRRLSTAVIPACYGLRRRASKSAEEWLRRFQTVVFSPMAMINAWASGTKPWSYPEVAEQIKQLALLRMQMMPYWYTEFARYHFEGIPVFRGMNLEEGFTMEIKKEAGSANLEENPYAEATGKEIKDQYMAGEYLLVAPLFAGQK